MRAVRRVAPDRMLQARLVLDAVHLAAAAALGDDLDGVVTYDEPLAGTARVNGLAVLAPARTSHGDAARAASPPRAGLVGPRGRDT